jgi:hypothetical protein
LEFIFQAEKYLDLTITIEIKEETIKKISRKLEKINFLRARDAVLEFLKYAYGVEEYIFAPKGSIEPIYEPPWLADYKPENLTRNEKVYLLLKHNHPNQWVRSQDLQEEYEIVYGEKIKLSSLSTYLARFYEKGMLERKGSRAQWEYKFSPFIEVS